MTTPAPAFDPYRAVRCRACGSRALRLLHGDDAVWQCLNCPTLTRDGSVFRQPEEEQDDESQAV